jgi:exopolysaccharide production protein ExoQ
MMSTVLNYPLRNSPAISRFFSNVVILSLTAAFSILALGVVAAGVLSWDTIPFIVICTVFMVFLCLARPYSATAFVASRESFLAATLVIWTFLMVSEGIFVHVGATASAVGGHFDATAYYEATSWGLCFLALGFLTCFRPLYLWSLFRGQLKWVALFAVIAVLSCPLSPNFFYSLTMAFKLSVVVLTLLAMAESIDDEAGIAKLFTALLVGALILAVAGTITPFLGPGHAFKGARFGAVIGLSGTAGFLLLLSVLYLLLKKSPWFLLTAVFSLSIMLLAGGKGGIAATLVALIMFFVMLKRAGQAILVCIGLTTILTLFIAFTPVGDALQKYNQSENGSTLSGRTNLWTAVVPEIKRKPILGHGYRASRFVSSEVEGAFAEAGHIHNAFLEVLYNNGIVGLIPILIMNFLIVINLGKVIKLPIPPDIRYYATAALALYMHLLLWGLTAPTFGGTPDHRFMIFFAVLLVSIRLRMYFCDTPASQSAI